MTYSAVVRALLVVNPQATATTPAGREILARALSADLKLEVLETNCRGHATDAAAKAAAEGIDLVVAHGGDGTVNEVVNGVLALGTGTNAPLLGVVPGGSANVFAGALGLPRDPVEATHRLLKAIEAGREKLIGLGRADSRWFTFNAGMGWDAEVVASVDGQRRKQASVVMYARTTLTTYVRQAIRPPAITISLPDEEPVTDVRAAMICNTSPWSYLGSRPLPLVPSSSFDRGLGLYALRSLSAPAVVRASAQLLLGCAQPRGRHLLLRDDVPHIWVSSDKPLRVQVDGDLVGVRKRVQLVAVPNALRVVV